MPGTCVIGLQWGDEAKGKLVDLLTPNFDIVVRYQGGANAGHTVVVGDETYKLHHVPSGILSENVMNVVTAGVVLSPPTILEEIDSLTARGIPVEQRMMLSDRAHVVFPWHFVEDRVLNESTIGGENIGTTLRGIGPCYRDKIGRTNAVRLGDLLRSDFKQRVEEILAAKQPFLPVTNSDQRLDARQIYQEYTVYAQRLRPMIRDTTAYLLDAVEANQRLLFEGAQGALLDIDHGTFPFVTSSNSSGAGVSAGSGVPGRWVDRVIGVIKTYSTRVGGGPFPTELENQTGNLIRERGKEYGTTTGRPRRCGWFDGVAARYTARLSGVDYLSAMMLDVLSTLPELKICVAYEINGRRTREFPSHADDLRQAVPIYETLPGWQEEITEVRILNELPQNAQDYLKRIHEIVGCPVGVVSIGPRRDQTILVSEELSTVVC